MIVGRGPGKQLSSWNESGLLIGPVDSILGGEYDERVVSPVHELRCLLWVHESDLGSWLQLALRLMSAFCVILWPQLGADSREGMETRGLNGSAEGAAEGRGKIWLDHWCLAVSGEAVEAILSRRHCGLMSVEC